MAFKKKAAGRSRRWSHRAKRGLFILALMLAFGVAGVILMSASE